MLYQLSYASSLGNMPQRHALPTSVRCRVPLQNIITATHVQAEPRLLPPSWPRRSGCAPRTGLELGAGCYDWLSLALPDQVFNRAWIPERPRSMRIRRRLPVIAGVLVLAAGVALIVVLRKHAPPEPARLLPGADGFVYINFQWMRRADVIGRLPPVAHDTDYDDFIQATGFQFERDLEQAAIAIHYASQLPQKEEPRFSEIFVGKIHGDRLRDYLRKVSRSVENYRSADIYAIPLEGRTVRVAILTVDSVAASNVDDPQVIRGMIDRSRKLASPFGGPALLRRYYRSVPLASLAWAVFRVDPSMNVFPSSPDTWAKVLSEPAVMLASIRYLGTLHLRAVAFTGSEKQASALVDRVSAFLRLMHAAEVSLGAKVPDPDIRALFDSLEIQQQRERAVLNAKVPLGLVRKLLAEAPVEVTPPPKPPSEPGTPPTGKEDGQGK